MFKTSWDKENNGVKLDFALNEDSTTNPRPVFFEELDLLGFRKYWKYPKSIEPLLWAIDRKYFYKGEEVAKAIGGNIYEAPQIELTEKGKNLKLQPININKILHTNKDALFTLENEAMDFIEKAFKTYRPNVATLREKNGDSPITTEIKSKKTGKIDFFIASFSGGKDSQVVLDLVSRVIPPEHYKVVYTDTGMELPSSIEIYEKTKERYQKTYPSLHFHKEKNTTETDDYWRQFGPPSRFHRWCCTVIKTAPFNRAIKKMHDSEKTPRILAFEGVRREESSQRSMYERIAKGVKHVNMTNSRPIIQWNISEVWLYLFYRNMDINIGYRNGLYRVGCSVCPFAHGKTEYIINQLYPNLMSKYTEILKSQVGNRVYNGNNEIEYLKQGDWKMVAGGKFGTNKKNRFDIIKQKPDFEAIIDNPNERFIEWLKILGDVIVTKKNNITYGELKLKNSQILKFSLQKQDSKLIVKIPNLIQDAILFGKIRKILFKTTYCIHCEACQVECQTGALSVNPIVKINSDTCTHCLNCITFKDKGCLLAKTKHISEGGKNMNKKTSGLDKYNRFGFSEKWLIPYFDNLGSWFAVENTLGSHQKSGLISWLRDAELMSENDKQPTEFAFILKNCDLQLKWELIWINLFYNSSIVNWYLHGNNWGIKLEKEEAIEKIRLTYDLSDSTIKNALNSFNITVFETTSKALRTIAHVKKKGRSYVSISKIGYDDINPISIAYSLYKYAEDTNRYSFTVSEMYSDKIQGGAYKIFGISQTSFENKLRSLQENKHRIIEIALVAGLDNINLREDLTSIEVLKLLIQN